MICTVFMILPAPDLGNSDDISIDNQPEACMKFDAFYRCVNINGFRSINSLCSINLLDLFGFDGEVIKCETFKRP